MLACWKPEDRLLGAEEKRGDSGHCKVVSWWAETNDIGSLPRMSLPHIWESVGGSRSLILKGFG